MRDRGCGAASLVMPGEADRKTPSALWVFRDRCRRPRLFAATTSFAIKNRAE